MTKARELFDFAVDYLTSKGCVNLGNSFYGFIDRDKMISLSYYINSNTLAIRLLSHTSNKESAVLELSYHSQITTVLDILLFAIEKEK